MGWREVPVAGIMSRGAVDKDMARNAAAMFELKADALPPHSYECSGMWFVNLMLTDVISVADVPGGEDQPDEPMSTVAYTGTVDGTGINIQLIYVGEMFDRFLVED